MVNFQLMHNIEYALSNQIQFRSSMTKKLLVISGSSRKNGDTNRYINSIFK